MKPHCPQRIKPTLTLVQPKVNLKVSSITIYYRFVQKDIDTALSCQNIWSLQDSRAEFSFKWRIKTKAMHYKSVSAVHGNVT